MKKFVVSIFCIFCFSFLFGSDLNKSIKGSRSTPRKIVTVGYVVNGVDRDANGTEFKKAGYAYEYIQKLMSYTGWKCDYVYGTWNEIYEKLVSGKIDMMPNVVRTEERSKLFNFTHFSMGQETYVLFTSLDRLHSDPKDYESLNGIKVGIVDNSIHEQMLAAWTEMMGITVEVVHFSDEFDRYENFKNGVIDAFVDLDIFSAKDIYPIAKLDTKDIYFAFSKQTPELCRELNNAMASLLYLNPYYNSNLWTKYYSNIFAQKELLDEERDWLSENNLITVGVIDDDFPYCYKTKDGEVAGYVVDLLNFSKENFNSSNLVFQYKVYKNYTELLQALESGYVDMVFPVYMSLEQAEMENYILSDTVYSVGMSYICNNATNEMAGDVAVAFTRLGPSYMQDFYPNTSITLYDTRKNCLEAVLDRQCEGAVFNTIQLENFIHKSRKYRVLKMINLPHPCDIGFAVTRENLTLLSLVNRGICSISAEEKAKSITYHTMQNSNYTLKDFLADYVELIVFFAILILLLLLLLVISLDKLRAYLNYDSLTRLLNRRTMSTYLENAKRKADEKGDPFCLLMLDIDDFKHVNDVYGHACGDEVLKAVAKSIMHSVSSNDYIFRWGGEEILVLVNTDATMAVKIAERIRRGIQNLNIEYKNNIVNVTATIGLVQYEKGMNLKVLFEQADNKMYEGKTGGKNTVVS